MWNSSSSHGDRRMKTAGFVVFMLLLVMPVAVFSAGSQSGKRSVEEKLQEIVIPKIEFEEATLKEVIAFLRQQACELDPDGIGVNLFVKLAPKSQAAGGRQPQAPTFTMNMQKVTLGEAIRYVCLAGGLNFRVESDAVVIADNSLPLTPMESRVYRVAPGVLDTPRTRSAPKDFKRND